MSTRTFILAVTGCASVVAACGSCGSYGTSVVEVGNTRMPVASVSVQVPLSLAAGETARATAIPKDADGKPLADRAVVWYTSSASTASINDAGVISAVAPGTAIVSAVSEGVSGQATMAITPPTPTPIATVTVMVYPSAVLVGQTALATATLEDSSGRPLTDRQVTWTSSDITVATVDTTGKVKAIGPGQSMIKASSSGKTNSSRLNVSAPAPVPVASVSVSPTAASLQLGASVQLSAATLDSNNNVLTGRVIGWASSKPGVATVSSLGLVTAIAAGSASITASSEGQTASSAVTVAAPAPVAVASVAVSPATSSLLVGGTVQLSAVTRDANNNVLTGRSISWTSSNTGISTVSAAGLVTAIAAGSATITALSETKSGTAAITVSAPAPVSVASVSVSPATATVLVGGTVQFSAVTRDANNNVLTGRSISWSSNNPALATVSATGVATAVAAGTIQITATSEGKSGSATLTDTSPSVPSGVSDTIWRRNEPAGMTTVSDRPFNALNEMGWTDGGGSGQFDFRTDSTGPHSRPGVMHAWWPAGYAGGDGPVGGNRVFGPYRTIYVAYWAKLSANFYGHAVADKQFYVYTPSGVSVPYFATVGPGTEPLRPQMRLQNSISWSPNPGGGNLDPNIVPTARVPRDRWYLLEAVFVGNTAGNQDGSVDWYLDGVHIGSYSIQWEAGAVTWTRFHYTTIWGGVGGTVPAEMSVNWDHVYISGKN